MVARTISKPMPSHLASGSRSWGNRSQAGQDEQEGQDDRDNEAGRLPHEILNSILSILLILSPNQLIDEPVLTHAALTFIQRPLILQTADA